MLRYMSENVGQTEEIAQSFAKELKEGDIIAFCAEMGAGKTAFVRGLAKGLNIDDDVTSPTFSIINEYFGGTNLIHCDMYRIQSYDTLYSTGFFDYLDYKGILAIEWSENITFALPDTVIFIFINKVDTDKREIVIKGGCF